MSESTTVVVEEPADDAGNSDFAAGVATAVAGQAQEDAATAEVRAETAELVAGAAVERAEAAEAEAYDARAEIELTRTEFRQGLEGVHAALAALKPPEPVVEEQPAAPAPEAKPEQPAASTEATEDKPKRTSYGSGTWFGKR